MDNESVNLLYGKIDENPLTMDSSDALSLQSARDISSRYSSTKETRCWGDLDVEFEEVVNGSL